MAIDKSPIILQTLWRSCGTYFWNAFRKETSFRCFNEPLFEDFAFVNECEFMRRHRSSITSSLHHPKLNSHYFSEYDFQRGYVSGYKLRFAYQEFILQEDAQDIELLKYLNNLVRLARINEQRPVFKFVRGTLRTRWLKRNLPDAKVIYINRNFSDVVTSSLRYGGRGSYFVAVYALILALNFRDPVLSDAADYFGVEAVLELTQPACVRAQMTACACWPEQKVIDIVYFFWSLSLAFNISLADLVIDLGSPSTDEKLSAEIAYSIFKLTGTIIDLSTLKIDRRLSKMMSPSAEVDVLVRNALYALEADTGKLSKSTSAQTPDRL